MIIFPSPESAVIRALKRAGLAASTSVPPSTWPAANVDGFVRVQAVGGGDRHLVLSQRLVQISAYAPKRAAAARLAEVAVAALMAAPYVDGEQDIRAVGVTGEPADFPDPNTDAPRYTATLSLVLRSEQQ